MKTTDDIMEAIRLARSEAEVKGTGYIRFVHLGDGRLTFEVPPSEDVQQYVGTTVRSKMRVDWGRFLQAEFG